MRRALVLGVAWLAASAALAQTRALIPGGSRAHAGVVELLGDGAARELRVQSGGNLDVAAMRLGPECRGFATERPDAIVRLAAPGRRLTFYVRATTGDVTLVVHTPDGRWLCDDDGAGGTNPRLEVTSPLAGQYDVWVGGWRADQVLATRLHVTPTP